MKISRTKKVLEKSGRVTSLKKRIFKLLEIMLEKLNQSSPFFSSGFLK